MNMATLSDHQESEHFTYDRSWDEMEKMLYKAEKEKNMWESKYYDLMQINAPRKEIIKCLRNIKALEGVVKTLRWTLGDKNVAHPLN